MQDILCLQDVMKFGLRGYKETVNYNWHGRMITIRYLLPREELCSLLHDIHQMCLSPGGDFLPELLDFALRAKMVDAYALVELPDDIDEMYKLLYSSDLYDVVLSNANKNQTNSILAFFGYERR